MVAKKGFMRIVEATIASLLILGVLLTLSVSNKNSMQNTETLEELLPSILEEIALNSTLREKIINYITTEIYTVSPNK